MLYPTLAPEFLPEGKPFQYRSAKTTTGYIRNLVRRPQRSGKMTGPRFRHSFKLFILLFALDDASYTMHILVVALWGVNTG